MRTNDYFRKFKLVLGIITVVLLTSCLSQRKAMLLQDNKATSFLGNVFENGKKITYHVQTGDHLYIKVYSIDVKTSKLFQSDLPALMNPTYLYLNSYVVDEQGYINYSFIDKMYVRGLTIEEIRNLLQKTMNEYFKDVTVVVRLVDYQVAVLGEVGSPGNFTVDKDQINIYQAIGLAGGFKPFANVKKVKIIRQTVKGSEIYEINLGTKEILQSDYFYLMPNDIVYVEPLKSKSFLFERIPYEMFFTMVSLGIAVAALLNNK
jgi:polysaccharide biosynthesis/export protein